MRSIEYFMTDQVLWSKYQSVDIDGTATHDAPQVVTAYVLHESSETRQSNGETISTPTTVYTQTRMQIGDLVWLPGNFESASGLKRDSLQVQAATYHRSIDGCDAYWKAVL